MSFTGNGTFVINTAGQPVVANTVISATVFNALTSDLATGLSTCITKDGQTTVTANIPFGNNKITSLGAGTAATDASNMSQVQSTAAKLITVTGTDTITGTMSPALASYAAGQLFYFIANAANTGAMTINIDGLGAKSITRDGSTALIAGDVNTGEIVVICYDGTRFQMINAANSFGNTTINGTLTVTGNTGLQANVSITSTLSVGGTFAVTGAATLGSTLAVTGKSDLPTVSTASINAAVALITTGTVTNLTASGASIASANIGNLQFTAASIASINAGVAVVTNLTATSASIASMNAGVALVTTATITGLTATGASVASANVGTAVITTGTVTNLTSTSASVASMNAGVALLTTATVTNLTATGASVASANFGNVVTTTERVTNFSATSASIASINAAVALVTTGTVTNLTSTSASIASANVGTAVVTGLTVTGASIASVNAGTATLSGNLTLNGGTANGVLYLDGSKVATSGSAITFDGTNFATTGTATATKLVPTGNVTAGNGMYLPTTNTLAWSTDGSERMRIDSSGNLGLGVTPSAGNAGIKAFQIGALNGLYMMGGSGVAQIGSNYYFSSGYKYGTTGAATNYETEAGAHKWYTAPSGTAGNAITFTQAMTLDASGNLLVGTTTTSSLAGAGRGLIEVNGSSDSAFAMKANNTLYGYLYNSASEFRVANVTSNPVTFFTNNAERGRFTAGGYFKASNTGTYVSSTSTYHELRNDANANTVRISNSIASGYTDAIIQTQFSGYTPNAATAWFLFCDDTTNQKAGILSTGTFESRTGTYGGVSDVKLKTNIVDANSQWDDLKSVRVRNFEFKDEPENTMLGVVAQEIEEVSPGLVYETPDRDKEGNDLGTTTKSVKYSVLYMKAVKALQEAMARIEQLEAKVAALESK